MRQFLSPEYEWDEALVQAVNADGTVRIRRLGSAQDQDHVPVLKIPGARDPVAGDTVLVAECDSWPARQCPIVIGVSPSMSFQSSEEEIANSQRNTAVWLTKWGDFRYSKHSTNAMPFKKWEKDPYWSIAAPPSGSSIIGFVANEDRIFRAIAYSTSTEVRISAFDISNGGEIWTSTVFSAGMIQGGLAYNKDRDELLLLGPPSSGKIWVIRPSDGVVLAYSNLTGMNYPQPSKGIAVYQDYLVCPDATPEQMRPYPQLFIWKRDRTNYQAYTLAYSLDLRIIAGEDMLISGLGGPVYCTSSGNIYVGIHSMNIGLDGGISPGETLTNRAQLRLVNLSEGTMQTIDSWEATIINNSNFGVPLNADSAVKVNVLAMDPNDQVYVRRKSINMVFNAGGTVTKTVTKNDIACYSKSSRKWKVEPANIQTGSILAGNDFYPHPLAILTDRDGKWVGINSANGNILWATTNQYDIPTNVNAIGGTDTDRSGPWVLIENVIEGKMQIYDPVSWTKLNEGAFFADIPKPVLMSQNTVFSYENSTSRILRRWQ